MNAELKQQWIEALRIGSFKQGRHMLRDGEGFCCLGVLCEVMEIPRGEYGYLIDHRDEENNISFQVLPLDVQDALTRLNDRGETFSTIADYIEETL